MDIVEINSLKTNRKSTYPIASIILNRWSPRSMDSSEMKDGELMPLFEAARWAPSSYNAQLWRFVYSKRNSDSWSKFVGLLNDGNKQWASKASVLAVVISRKTFDHNGKPSRTHAFDAGAAWENLALEGASRGLVVHGMEGFDYDRAKSELGINDDYEVHCMVAIGKRDKAGKLPDEKMREGEKPNERKPLSEIIMEGKFRV